MADPGFPRGGGTNPLGGGPTYDFAKFSQKLHKIERISTPEGRHASLAPPLDLPLYWEYKNIACKICIVILDDTITTQTNRF